MLRAKASIPRPQATGSTKHVKHGKVIQLVREAKKSNQGPIFPACSSCSGETVQTELH